MIDLLLDIDGDLHMKGGDLVLGTSVRQHQQLLLWIDKGALRQHPTVGVGLRNYLLDEVRSGTINAAVKRGFEDDGMRVTKVQLRGGAVQIEAHYE